MFFQTVCGFHLPKLRFYCSAFIELFQIQFPGVTQDTFGALLHYLYTGQCPLLANVDCVELIELANRLCLPRLLALTERHIVTELTAAEKEGKEILEDVISTLSSVQVSQHLCSIYFV